MGLKSGTELGSKFRGGQNLNKKKFFKIQISIYLMLRKYQQNRGNNRLLIHFKLII